MLQLSNKLLIFVPWFRKRLRHRGELLSFDPPVNLENSSDKGKSLKAASPAVAYILLIPLWGHWLCKLFHRGQNRGVICDE